MYLIGTCYFDLKFDSNRAQECITNLKFLLHVFILLSYFCQTLFDLSFEESKKIRIDIGGKIVKRDICPGIVLKHVTIVHTYVYQHINNLDAGLKFNINFSGSGINF